jgi:putative phage-type endonuclease
MTDQQTDRSKFIGASEAAAACGVSPYRTPLDVYREKLEGSDFEGNDFTWFGNQLEPTIIKAYARKYPDRYVWPNEVNTKQKVYLHKDIDFICATPDAFFSDEDVKHAHLATGGFSGLVECKAFNPMRKKEFGEDGSPDVPIDCLFQCQQQMAVLGADRCDLAVLFGVNDFHVYHIERDDKLIEQIIEIETKLWKCIQEKRPPQIDPGHKEAVASLKKYYRQMEGEPVELNADIELAARELAEYKEDKKEAERNIAICQAKVLQAIGNAPAGILSDGSMYKRIAIKERIGTLGDVEKAQDNVGKVTRKASVQLRHVKGRKTDECR